MPNESKDRCLLLTLLVLALILSAAPYRELLAQSGTDSGTYLIFPQFASSAGLSSSITVFNPSGKDASAVFMLRNVEGNLLANASLTIPAHGQAAKTAGELFPSAAMVRGSVALASATSGLVAYYQSFNGDLSILDGGTPSDASNELLFPVVPAASDGTSEITIHNPNARPTAAELSLWSFSGNLLGKASVRVPSGGVYSGDPQNIFPSGTDFSEASHITAVSRPVNIFGQPQSISGSSSFAGFSSVLVAGGSLDSGALNAKPLTGLTNTGVIPFFRTGIQDSSTLCLSNAEPAPIQATVTALANDGTPLGTRTVSLPGNGGLRSSTQSFFPNQAGEREGWILIQASGRVHASVLFGKNNNGSLSAVAVQPLPMTDIIFPYLLQGPGYSMELSVVNPGSKTAYVSVYAVHPSGATLASTQVVLAPGARVSKSLNRFMPEITSQLGGYLYVDATEPVFAANSLWVGNSTSASSFVPQPLTVSYQPAKLSRFSVTGAVSLNGNPAQGMRVVLSGTVGGLATTDAEGYYAFTGLPAGHYSMGIDQSGFEFFSTQVNFEITNASIRQDFKGYTAADAIVVQPGFLPILSPDTSVNVFGHGFTSTSMVFAGTVQLNTTFVDSTHLTAVVPQYMLALPARFDVCVHTGSSVTQNYTMTAYQSRPVLNSITVPGDIMEGNAGTTLTLRGSGFLPGLTVKVNGVSDGISLTLVDSTQVLASVPASFFQHGGIYPVVVRNSLPSNVESNIQLLTVYFPSPEIDEVLPNELRVKLEPGSGSTDIELQGFNFRRGAVVLFDGTPLSTRYCEDDDYCLATRLFASIPAGLMRSSGFAHITVKNPSPTLACSGEAIIRMDGLMPTITGIVPGTARIVASTIEYSMPVIVNGTNFGPQTMVALYQGAAPAETDFALPAAVLSTTQLYVDLPVKYPDALGTWYVQVLNPPPAGGVSDAGQFIMTEANFDNSPFLISMDPVEVAAGGPGFTLTIKGTNFRESAQIQFLTTTLPASFVNSGEVMVEIPANLIKTAGRFPVTLINPDTGGASNRLFMDVR